MRYILQVSHIFIVQKIIVQVFWKMFLSSVPTELFPTVAGDWIWWLMQSFQALSLKSWGIKEFGHRKYEYLGTGSAYATFKITKMKF